MIVTLTLNPSLDRTIVVDRLVPGAVLRTSEPTLEPGGKGVNLTRALSSNGIPSVAILPVGGREGAELMDLLDAAAVDFRSTAVAGRTRSNISVVDQHGAVTKLNEPGFALDDREVLDLTEVVSTIAMAGDWVVISGSVPPGFSGKQLSSLTSRLIARGIHLAVDTSGDVLGAAIDAKPRLVKPNREELEEIAGTTLECISDVIEAATAVRDRGVELVLVSLGADGAVLVGPGGVLVGTSTVEYPRSTVGAGDCFLAGFLSKFSVDETNFEEAMLEALAWGAAAASLPGTAMPSTDAIDFTNVQLVWQPDLDRPLLAS